MRELRPTSFTEQLNRLTREIAEGKCYDLPVRAYWAPVSGADLSVRFHGLPAATPVGPAAGPHSQMAQNILLSYMAGGRIFELKTVQIMDRLKIPRPCIDSRNVGFNIEWSQELLIEESLHEYAVAAWLVEIARGENWIRAEQPLTPEQDPVIYDISVGYDLNGIKSRRVVEYLEAMKNATAVLDRLEKEVRASHLSFARYRPTSQLASTTTLSTFHGCPPGEIEGIVTFLLEEMGLHVVVKMNPTMLGQEKVEHLLREKMGYKHLRTNPKAYEVGLKFDESLDLIRGLKRKADKLGLGLNLKFSNTLETLNDEGHLPASEPVMYASGAPLHVITTVLMDEWRGAMGWQEGMSFSAGVDRQNLKHLMRCGCVPITICTDLLKPGGYARMSTALRDYEKALRDAGKASLREDVSGPEQWSKHLADYARQVPEEKRYWHEKNAAVPKKLDSHLEFYDCVNCDKCIPVCPNDAMFSYEVAAGARPIVQVGYLPGQGFSVSGGEALIVEKEHQLANFADWCNECGNCQTHCPEHGGPFIEKPRFFSSRASYLAAAPQEGFFCSTEDGLPTITGRLGDREYTLQLHSAVNRAFLRDEFFLVEFDLTTHEIKEMHLSQVLPDGRTLNTEVYHKLRDHREQPARSAPHGGSRLERG